MSTLIRSYSSRPRRFAAFFGVAVALWSTCSSGYARNATTGSENQAAQKRTAAATDAEPWTPADVLEPEQLVKRLSDPKATQPEILYVGPPALYKGSHIPRAKLIGLTSRPEGLSSLAEAVKGTAKDREIIIYCGCCPWDVCPNIRPAFTALRERGFTRVRLLHLPSTFTQDWVKRGYPVEKGE